MNEIGSKLKGYLILITYAILLYLGLSHISEVLAFLGSILVVLTPFILGIIFAYVLNILMSFFERKLYFKLDKSKKAFPRKLKRPLSIFTTFAAVFLFITIMILFIVPQVAQSITTLTTTLKSAIPNYLDAMEAYINDLADQYNVSGGFLSRVSFNWSEIIAKTTEFITTALPQILIFTLGLTNGIINFVMGLIISIYLLATKEKMIKTMKKLVYAFTSRETSAKLIDTGAQANITFQNFISGQITEALILGVLVFIGMLIFGFPYAALCSVIIAVTSVIPVFGAWIGIIPSVFFILMTSPSKAIWFIVFIIVLQQLENNLIYPRVVGSSIGLDGLWVLFALIVGGSLFGLTGVLLGIPAFAVIYTIIRRITNRKLKEKNIVVK